MKKLILVIVLFILFNTVNTSSVSAAGMPFDCDFKITVNPSNAQIDPGKISNSWTSISFSFDLGKITDDQWAIVPLNMWNELRIIRDSTAPVAPTSILYGDTNNNPYNCGENIDIVKNVSKSQKLSYSLNNTGTQLACGRGNWGNHIIHVYTKDGKDLCKPGEYHIVNTENADIEIKPVDKNGNSAPPDVDAYWDVNITNVTTTDPRHSMGGYDVDLDKSGLSAWDGRIYDSTGMKDFGISPNKIFSWTYGKNIHFILNPLYDPAPNPTVIHTITVNNNGAGPLDRYIINSEIFTVYPRGKDPVTICSSSSAQSAKKNNSCSKPFDICDWCITKDTSKSSSNKTQRPKTDKPQLKPLCDQLSSEFSGKCWECQRSGEKIWTAIGCIPISYTAVIKDVVLGIGVGIAGGVAFLYFLYGAFMILTSTGNAEKLEEAKQIITSALAGLILIIFSIFLLKTIGVDILQLPGFK